MGSSPSKSRTLPFLLSFNIFNHNVHNCLVDSGEAANVMSLSVCKRINGQPMPSTGKIIQLDRTTVKVVGEMNDVLIRLVADERVCQFINIYGSGYTQGLWPNFEKRLVCENK